MSFLLIDINSNKIKLIITKSIYYSFIFSQILQKWMTELMTSHIERLHALPAYANLIRQEFSSCLCIFNDLLGKPSSFKINYLRLRWSVAEDGLMGVRVGNVCDAVVSTL